MPIQPARRARSGSGVISQRGKEMPAFIDRRFLALASIADYGGIDVAFSTPPPRCKSVSMLLFSEKRRIRRWHRAGASMKYREIIKRGAAGKCAPYRRRKSMKSIMSRGMPAAAGGAWRHQCRAETAILCSAEAKFMRSVSVKIENNVAK